LLKPLDRAHDLGQAAGVEQLAIQVVSFAVVTQIEAHDLEPGLEERLRQ
jgi:hypothetical protein